MTREGIIQETDEAFRDVPCPTADVAPYEYPCDGIAEELQGRNRDDLTDAAIREIIGDENLHLLGPEALQYYWPRFVKFSLSGSPHSGDFLFHVAYLLSIADHPHSSKQFSLFTADQRQTVVHYLECLLEHEELDLWDLQETAAPALGLWRRLASSSQPSL